MIKQKLYSLYRWSTALYRPLPDFLIIGAQKAGTSSLHYYLSQHPQLIPSVKKEIHYFDGGNNPVDDSFKKGQYWYRSHFPLKFNITRTQKFYETSPQYFINPLAPKRIYNLIPQAKLIVLLRNPTDRAISHYLQVKRKKRENLPLLEALKAEETRIDELCKKGAYKDTSFRFHTYKTKGIYKNQLKMYYNFFPKDQVLLINSETLFSSPSETLKKVFNFLDVDSDFVVYDLEPVNVRKHQYDIDPKVYQYLDDFFLPYNNELFEMIDERYDW